MLARRGEPFDSDKHLFEIKWDGTRAQARITDGGYLLTNRNRRDLTARYPELAFLADLEPGSVTPSIIRHDIWPLNHWANLRHDSTLAARLSKSRYGLV